MHPPVPGTKRTWVRKDRPVLDDPTFGQPSPPPQPKRKRLTPSQVAWLFVCQPHKLTERQSKQLEIVCQAGNDFQHVYKLAQEFVMMVTQQQAEVFEGWVQRAEHCGIASLKGLAKGLRRDAAAVTAALTLPWRKAASRGADHAAQAAQTPHVRQSHVRVAAPPGAPCRLNRACLHDAQ